MKIKTIPSLCLVLVANLCLAQQTYYDVTSGNGYGVRFWQSDLYKIHMGHTSEYLLGPVTDYSIKMNMNNTAGRGWTWGISGSTPIAAISNTGHMQVAASLHVGPYFGTSNVGTMSVSGAGGELSLLNRGVTSFVYSPTQGERWVIYNDGTATDGRLRFWTGGDKVVFTKEGSVGIGNDNPEAQLHVGKNAGGWARSVRMILEPPVHSGAGWEFSVRDNPTSSFLGMGYGTEQLVIHHEGNVGIGTTNPGTYKLAVEGKVGAREVNVTTGAWSDYVFNKNYNLRPLSEVQQFIDEHHHLPDVPSEKDVLANGQNLGEMNAILLKKVEELTLYVIELKKENERQQAEIDCLKNSKKP